MSPHAEMVPPLYSERKVLHMEPDQLLHQSHLVIIMPKSKKNVRFFSTIKQEKSLFNILQKASDSMYVVPSLIISWRQEDTTWKQYVLPVPANFETYYGHFNLDLMTLIVDLDIANTYP